MGIRIMIYSSSYKSNRRRAEKMRIKAKRCPQCRQRMTRDDYGVFIAYQCPCGYLIRQWKGKKCNNGKDD